MVSIEELTIGSHVLFNEERVEVWSLGQEHGLYDIVVHNKAKKYEDNMFHSSKEPYLIRCGVDALSPIPITEELLTELGFEPTPYKQEEKYFRELDNKFYIVYNYKYKIVNIGQNDNEPYLHDWGFMEANNLHELEAFVYLTTKQRLI